MNILHIEYAGGTGGIEKLCKDIGLYQTDNKNFFWFVHEGGILCDEMVSAGLDVLKTSYANSDIFKVYQRLVKEVDERGIDVVVIHHPAPLIWLAAILYLKKRNRAKVFVYAHNTYLEIIKRDKKKQFIYNRLLKGCDRIIAISEFVKQTFLNECTFLSDGKIKVIYNGVQSDNYTVNRTHKHEGRIKLIFVGRLIREKGIQVLIDALSEMKHSGAVQVSIVGDGPEREKLCSMAEEKGVSEIITFWGLQRNISERLADADIFVHPAIWEEGFGITIVEAMSAGLVCVAFKKGAIPEIIESGKSGFVVPECSPEALAAQLDELVEKIEINNLIDIRQNAMERVKLFSLDNMLRKLNEAYSE